MEINFISQILGYHSKTHLVLFFVCLMQNFHDLNRGLVVFYTTTFY